MSSLMLFDRGGVRMALDDASVGEVIAVTEPAAVPLLPRHLLGLIPWRARALVVLDLAPLLDLPSGASCGHSLVVHAGDYEAAIVCERVRGLCALPEELEPVPARLPGGLRDYARGIIPDGAEAIVVLDERALLAAAAVGGG